MVMVRIIIMILQMLMINKNTVLLYVNCFHEADKEHLKPLGKNQGHITYITG